MTIKFLDSKRISTSPSSATSVQGYSQLNAGTNGWNIASGAGDGERLSLQIVSGSSIIADPIKEIKMKLYKNSSPTDTLYVRVRNSSDTILAEASKGASTLTGSLTEYTFTLNTGVILAQGDRINIEYTGSSGSGNIGCGVNNATEPSTVNCQKYDGSSYSDIDRTPDWQFDSSPSTTISILQSHPVNVQDNSILVEKDTANRYWRTPESTSADVNTTQTSEQDNSGIDGDPNGGGWGVQFTAGHALVGQEVRSIKVKTKFSNSSGNSVSMTARVYGSTKATLRATSTAISSSTLSQSYQDVTFVFPAGSRATLQAGDHIMIVTETAIMSSGAWFTPVKSSAGTNTHFTTWQGMDVNFYEQDASVAGGRELYYNPIVTGTIVPAKWTINPTFEDDFSSYADTTAGDTVWATNDTGRMRVNPSTDVFDFESTRNGSAATAYKTLSKTASNDKWLLRFRYNMSSSNNNDARLFIGLSSTTGNYGSTEDWLGIIIPSSSGHNLWAITDYNNAAVTIGSYSSFALTPATGTNYYVELIRVSSTSFKLNLYSDPAYSTLINSVTHTMLATVEGLSHLKIMNMNNDSAGYSMTGIIDDVSYYNGISSV